MKRFLALCLLACCIAVLSACQTSDLSNIPTGVSIDDTTVKAPVRAIPINPLDYIAEQTLTTQVTPVGNLLANPGFEFGSLDGWTACEAGAIQLSNDTYEGSGALEVSPGNCFYQSVGINPDTELTLSCYAKILSGNGWTGMGLGFADSNWNTIGDGASTIITGNSYQRYDVNTTAPANTKYVTMWFYSDNSAVVDSCSLYPEVEPPPPPPSSGNNLLENPDFEGLFDWSTGCSGVVGTETSGGVFIKNGGCMDQSLSASDISELQGKDYSYSCSVKNTGGYASMSIFLDGQPTSVVIPNSNSFQTIEVTGTAANNINSGFVSLYAEGESLVIASCSLTVDLPPPPSSGENLLDNGDFRILDANTKPIDWSKGCGGTWTSAAGIDRYGLLLQNGVCVDQTLSSEDISKLAGKEFSYSCYVRKFDSRYASMSIFLDGQSESTVIPLNNDFELIEINATAGQISSGFVSIYSEGAIVVDDCSLTVEDGSVQPGTQQWFDRFGAPTVVESKFRATSETVKTIGLSNGAVYTVNSIIPSGNTDPNGQRVINIRKYNRDGGLIFSKDEVLFRPATLDDRAIMTVNILDATSDEAGNLYVLESAVQDLSIARKYQLDLYIQKFNSSGDKLFEKQVFSEVYPVGEGARGAPAFKDIVYSANALYVSGRTNAVGPDATSYTTVTKFDTSANEQWVQRLSSTPFFRLEGLTANSNGDVYASAFSFGDSGTVQLTKLDSSGNQLWQRSVNNSLSGSELVSDDSNVYILGSTNNVLVEAENDRSDGYIWKYDNAGNQVWTSQYATNLIDTLYNGAIYNGNLYVTGSSTTEIRDSSNFFVSDSTVGFIKQIDTQTAAELWSTEIDIENDNIFVDIAVDSTGIYAGGYVAEVLERLDLDRVTNGSDAFITKYSLP